MIVPSPFALRAWRICTAFLLIAACAGSGSVALGAEFPPVDHGGADLTLSEGDVIWGVHTGIGVFTVPASNTVFVRPFRTNEPGSGFVEVNADTIIVAGTIDATGAGHEGGSGGGGRGASSGFGPPTGCGGSGPQGAPGLVFRDGNAGSENSGGSGAGPWSGTGFIPITFNGADGGYLAPGANGDTSTDVSIFMGSGAAGGIGGGGGGGLVCIFGSGGGGGGAGGAGGGAIGLVAGQRLVLDGGRLLTRGTTGGNGGAGEAFAGGLGGNTLPESGGNGGPGGRGSAEIVPGSTGRTGGAGAGGGILIKCLAQDGLTLDGASIDARGARDQISNGGTVKVFSSPQNLPLNASVSGGRILMPGIDFIPLFSQVDSLAPFTGGVLAASAVIDVPFSTNDNGGGGFSRVELFFRKDGGPWTRLDATFSESPISFDSSLKGGDGRYEFFTIVIDILGNREPEPALADASTLIATEFDGGRIYVDPDAPGARLGNRWGQAHDSIDLALAQAEALQMDEIWVAEGVYTDTVTINGTFSIFGGFEGFGGRVEATPEDRDLDLHQTLIDASLREGIADRSTPVRVTLKGDEAVRFDGFHLTGNFRNGIEVQADDSAVFTVSNCRIFNELIAIEIMGTSAAGSARIEVLNSLIEDNRTFGISVRSGISGLFDRCVIRNNSLAGIDARSSGDLTISNSIIMSERRGLSWGGGGSLNIINSMFVDNTRGVGFSTPDSNVRLANTIFTNNFVYAIFFGSPFDTVELSNCLFFDNVNGDILLGFDSLIPSVTLTGAGAINYVLSGATGNVDGDPMFVDALGGDFHILPGSPAIDAGIAEGAPAFDLDGNPRPVDFRGFGSDGPGAGFDIGAYELPWVAIQNNAEVVDLVAPASSPAERGFSADLTVMNTGDVPWSSNGNYKLALSDDPCGLWTGVFPRLNIPLGVVVPPGESHTFQLVFRAAQPAESCPVRFQMIQEFVGIFGPPIDIVFEITEPQATARGWRVYP